ncbi:unnamed protein product [Spirodela intermedia]|uniref:Uncharacterized protein n=2 Tax=Spirodela intermedia TaxID=51605 RepID=A0A7I8K1R9_SPIIN|nr:unnamed protein product [Spirodela intermedia]CAA6654787.1 unnamed protein product [Spirodela intermedia]CAA7389455.1 unnamed protein product [Spirodela intermedia]
MVPAVTVASGVLSCSTCLASPKSPSRACKSSSSITLLDLTSLWMTCRSHSRWRYASADAIPVRILRRWRHERTSPEDLGS